MPTYDQIDDLVSGNETATTDASGGKHGKFFFIGVPNYYGAVSLTPAYDGNGILTDASVKTSFVRIGAPPTPIATSWTQDPGANLVRMVYVVGPAGKVANEDVKARFTNPSSPEYDADLAAMAANEVAICAPFIDDERDRGTGNENPEGSLGHGLVAADRKAISDKLQSNVGWRDHADGNRITTTAGDKIEVIQGNYKLIVMGRQTDPSQAMGWEATGNNVQDFAGATMPGASVTVTWMKEAYLEDDVPGGYRGGAWLLQNSTERVYQYSRNAGNFKEENWGDLWETYVGSENPARVGKNDDDGTDGHPTTHYKYNSTTEELSEPMPTTSSVGLPRGNPHIIEKTWATKIESYTGSEDWHVPEIYEETWANSITEVTHCDGTISSETHAGSTTEETIVGTASSRTTANTIQEIATVGAATSIMVAGAQTDISLSANHLEITAGILHESLELTAATFELFLGTKLAIAISSETEISLGSRIAINVADSIEFNVGGTLEVNPEQKVELVLYSTGISLATKLLGANYQIG